MKKLDFEIIEMEIIFQPTAHCIEGGAMGLGAVGGVGPSDTSGADSSGGSEDSPGSNDGSGGAGIGIGSMGSFSGQSSAGITGLNSNNSECPDEESDPVNEESVKMSDLFGSYNKPTSTPVGFGGPNGWQDFSRALSATGGPPQGVTSQGITANSELESSPDELNEEANQPNTVCSDILSGVKTAVAKGVNGAISAIGQAVHATCNIATNGDALAQTALGVAAASVAAPVAAVAAMSSPSVTAIALNGQCLADFTANMAPGPPSNYSPSGLAGYVAGNLLDSMDQP
jgi:hypothetical protein